MLVFKIVYHILKTISDTNSMSTNKFNWAWFTCSPLLSILKLSKNSRKYNMYQVFNGRLWCKWQCWWLFLMYCENYHGLGGTINKENYLNKRNWENYVRINVAWRLRTNSLLDWIILLNCTILNQLLLLRCAFSFLIKLLSSCFY